MIVVRLVVGLKKIKLGGRIIDVSSQFSNCPLGTWVACEIGWDCLSKQRSKTSMKLKNQAAALGIFDCILWLLDPPYAFSHIFRRAIIRSTSTNIDRQDSSTKIEKTKIFSGIRCLRQDTQGEYSRT